MLRKITVFTLTLLVLAVPAFAQAAPDNEKTVEAYKYIGGALSVIGFGIAAGLGGLGQGKIGAAALAGTANNKRVNVNTVIFFNIFFYLLFFVIC